jgi:hypothetical protein
MRAISPHYLATTHLRHNKVFGTYKCSTATFAAKAEAYIPTELQPALLPTLDLDRSTHPADQTD